MPLDGSITLMKEKLKACHQEWMTGFTIYYVPKLYVSKFGVNRHQ